MPKKAEQSEFDQQFEKIKKLLKTIPETPGVYQMKDEEGSIIYIGKAKNLKHRVAQYFQLSKAQSLKVKKMVEKVQDIDIIETNSEMEALILETNLIKERRPRYNVLMKDDKNYVYIKVSTHEDYPRLSIVRKREKDGALYFGPKTSADACEKMINILRKIFPIRTCTLEMEDGPDGLINITKKTIPIPCLDYHIKRCAGPCINEIKQNDYKDMIKQIIRFLKGNVQEIITKLKYDMFNYANAKSFERASKLRDQIKAIENMFRKQLVSDPEFINRDVIGVHPDFDKTFINLFQFREGKLVTQENFTLDTPQTISSSSDEEQSSSVIESFLRSYYSETTDIPGEIFLREPPLDQGLWTEWLTERRHELNQLTGDDDRKKVHFLTPLKGKKNKVLELSEKNAGSFARQSRAKWMSDTAKTTQACRDLAEELGIEKELNRIECYDISHMGGEHSTASMVVFVKGSADKKLYRHFKIKTLENGEIDDYAAMDEIISRRLQRLTQFATPTTEHYQFKKPLKKDFELIEIALRDEKIISKEEKPDSKDYVGLYHGKENENQLVGYTQLVEYNNGDSAQIGTTWIEGEHLNRALKHQLWTKLIEKIKLPHIYAICGKEEKEDYLSYGFTELKKIPDFLINQKPTTNNQQTSYLIYKITKKTNSDTSFSQIPDLIIIDGGKGQLGIVNQIMKASDLSIPLIGLAKKEEEIFMPIDDEEERFQRIILPKNSQALYLVQRVRDESHRFANELRKKLGKKKLTESEIDDIPGVGLIIKRRLLKEFGSINSIKSAPMEDLERVVGAYIAKMLKDRLGNSSK
ncbi:MAG: excinuclease ABC subunit UvrC [Candidatus Gracilibacteria bacterium]|nr:excinuclease ABC subunit UvrC [bacterium]MDZ4216726.1 excinuclease ABC subunit UvrC [Candidatus Gracilibacteria bacterium]